MKIASISTNETGVSRFLTCLIISWNLFASLCCLRMSAESVDQKLELTYQSRYSWRIPSKCALQFSQRSFNNYEDSDWTTRHTINLNQRPSDIISSHMGNQLLNIVGYDYCSARPGIPAASFITFEDGAIRNLCNKKNIDPPNAPAKYNFSRYSGPNSLPIWSQRQQPGSDCAWICHVYVI